MDPAYTLKHLTEHVPSARITQHINGSLIRTQRKSSVPSSELNTAQQDHVLHS
jgi:hypothetical protein